METSELVLIQTLVQCSISMTSKNIYDEMNDKKIPIELLNLITEDEKIIFEELQITMRE